MDTADLTYARDLGRLPRFGRQPFNAGHAKGHMVWFGHNQVGSFK